MEMGLDMELYQTLFTMDGGEAELEGGPAEGAAGPTNGKDVAGAAAGAAAGGGGEPLSEASDLLVDVKMEYSEDGAAGPLGEGPLGQGLGGTGGSVADMEGLQQQQQQQ